MLRTLFLTQLRSHITVPKVVSLTYFTQKILTVSHSLRTGSAKLKLTFLSFLS